MSQANQKPKVTPIVFETYLAMIKNSVGTKMFRNLYADIDGERKDITQNGNLSCAVFVSSLLYLFKLIGGTHATVGSTVRDLRNSGWEEIKEPKEGCIIVWGETDFGGGELHKHIGFYVGDDKAISNDSKLGSPTEHDMHYLPIELLLWHPKLNN